MFSLLAATYLWDCYRSRYQGSLSHSLFAHLISLDPTLGLLEAGRISIALIIHSLDRRGSLSQSLFIPLIAPYKCTFQTGS